MTLSKIPSTATQNQTNTNIKTVNNDKQLSYKLQQLWHVYHRVVVVTLQMQQGITASQADFAFTEM
jgi:hypothetical protein